MPDWQRAHGPPVCAATVRSVPEDFVVIEQLGFEPAGDGEHDFLTIRKTGTNTAWLARQLARHARVAAVDVGYAGLKDRNAVTRQAFTVRRPGKGGTDWSALELAGVEILDVDRHHRKLRRGTHRANRFEIRLRGAALDGAREALRTRGQAIATAGVPNYFGEQRFGRDGANVELARRLFNGRRLGRDKRSIALSAARSLIFNAILDTRVVDGSWNRIVDGELAGLDGSGSFFAVTETDDEITSRCDRLDIHPTGSLWGDGAPRSSGAVAELERGIAAAHADLAEGLVKARLAAAQRALRLVPGQLDLDVADGTMMLCFELPRGAFATAVLRELCNCSSPG